MYIVFLFPMLCRELLQFGTITKHGQESEKLMKETKKSSI